MPHFSRTSSSGRAPRAATAAPTTRRAPAALLHRLGSAPDFSDFFCGYGGSSLGAEAAGLTVRVAYNHKQHAIDVHAANHPATQHARVNISYLDPTRTPRTHVGWFSPSCVRHSVAAGAKKRKASCRTPDLFADRAVLDAPLSDAETSRALMLDVPRFAEHHRYPIVLVENVVEAVSRWDLYPAWEMMMQALGYRVTVLSLNTRIVGVPQDRDRIFIVCMQRDLPEVDLDIRPEAPCRSCGADVQAIQTWKPAARRTAARTGRPLTGKYGDSYVYACPRCATVVTPYQTGVGVALDPSIPAPLLTEPRRGRMPSDTIRIRLEAALREFGPGGFVVTRNNTTHSGRVRRWSDPSFTLTGSPTLGVAFPDPAAVAALPRDVWAPVPATTRGAEHGTGYWMQHAPGVALPVEAMRYRRLEIQEARRIAGFPEEFVLLGDYEASHLGLGNAVTPAMAQLLIERTVPALG